MPVYTPKTWTLDDSITATDLNHIEEGLETATAAVVPTGGSIPFGGTSAPTGWLLADGTAVSRSTYAALFAVIGVAFGAGNGSTTFNLPDLRTRVPVGMLASDPDFHEIGHSGGSKDAALLAHTHPVAHINAAYKLGAGAAGAIVQLDGSIGFNANSGAASVGATDTGNQNMPPYVVANYIIKT